MKRALLLVAVLVSPAYAGPPEGGDHAEKTEKVEDPSQHFNFASHFFDYRKLDEYGGPLGDGVMTDDKTGETVREEEPMSAPFVLALVNFAILLLLLAKYLAPAGKKVAQERHDSIKTALDEAAKLRDEAKKKLGEYEARIAGLDAEIQKLVDGIRVDAEADKKRILDNAERQAAQMKHDAEQRIAAEIELARAQLRQEVAVAASSAATALVRDKATPDDQQRLVSSFISGLGGR